jgi:RNA polymerase sigma-70 factor (ECF subfamily)
VPVLRVTGAKRRAADALITRGFAWENLRPGRRRGATNPMEPVDQPRAQVRDASDAGDVSLMELVARCDPDAESRLVYRLLGRVQRATAALVPNPADKDDAAQVCMLEILRSARSYRGVGSIEAWSDRIVVRTALRFAKRRRRAEQRLDASADPDRIDSGGHDDPLSDNLPRTVRDYLAQLSEPRRTAIVLRHVLGYSIDEIASITRVSPNTVKDRLLTARREFRRLVRRDQVVGTGAARRTA